MISLKERAGQTLIEFLIAGGLVFLAGVFALTLLLRGMLTLIATRWAAQNSRCLATGETQERCEFRAKKDLTSYFALKKVTVKSRTVRGVIHSAVQGELMPGVEVRGVYDLGPSEYKRVSEKSHL